MTEKLLKDIADHYGAQHQTLKLAEEASELSAAAIRFAQARTRSDYTEELNHLIEEAADTLVLISQFAYHYRCEEKLKAMGDHKIRRTIKRMGESV
jgi:hypothetical protein